MSLHLEGEGRSIDVLKELSLTILSGLYLNLSERHAAINLRRMDEKDVVEDVKSEKIH